MAEPGCPVWAVGSRGSVANVPRMEPRTLDHIAFWVADRTPIVSFCERHLGMHVIADEANFTLVGSLVLRSLSMSAS